MAGMNMNMTAVFERSEKKYMVTRAQSRELLLALEGLAEPNQYGKYTICNVYYDTDDYQLIRHSLDKPAFKQKLRLRSYGVPSMEGSVFLELKKKFDGITYKRRIALPLRGAESYLRGSAPLPERTRISEEIDWFLSTRALSPKVLLCYDRIALCGVRDPGLRITVDSAIRWRDHGLSLSRGDSGALLLPEDRCIVEIKTSSAMPCELSGLLADMRIYPTSFSKYGTAYQQLLAEQKEDVRYAG